MSALAMGVEVALLTTLMAGLAACLAWMRRRFSEQQNPVIEAVDSLLPQTQCGQCGYPGCRPYAEAIARGEGIDLCPPGGPATQQALARLLGRDSGPTLPEAHAQRAVIDESRCIGCFLCIEACPVDAIVGAPRFAHTVIAEQCTGCELCLPPCPVDCIELVAEDAPALPEPPAATSACIRCGRCEPVCPESLPVARLWQAAQSGDPDAAVAAGLNACIECGLCNPVCPGDLDLVGTFRTLKAHQQVRDQAREAADLARRRFEKRRARLERVAATQAERRATRLARLKRN